jgi:hypothetical protein
MLDYKSRDNPKVQYHLLMRLSSLSTNEVLPLSIKFLVRSRSRGDQIHVI